MSERKVAVISGIAGQDGSYLAEFLLEKGYWYQNGGDCKIKNTLH